MSPTYKQNKKHIYNYYVNNPEKIKLIRVSQNHRCYMWRKAKFEFLNILFIT